MNKYLVQYVTLEGEVKKMEVPAESDSFAWRNAFRKLEQDEPGSRIISVEEAK